MITGRATSQFYCRIDRRVSWDGADGPNFQRPQVREVATLLNLKKRSLEALNQRPSFFLLVLGVDTWNGCIGYLLEQFIALFRVFLQGALQCERFPVLLG
jgi:hypothetical protein